MRCREEIIILRAEMQMCYLGYRSRARAWVKRGTRMAGHRAHEFMARENAGHWNDLAAYARKRFNQCFTDVIHQNLRPQYQ